MTDILAEQLNRDTRYGSVATVDFGAQRSLRIYAKNLGGPKFEGYSDAHVLIGTLVPRADGAVQLFGAGGEELGVAADVNAAITLVNLLDETWWIHKKSR